MRSAERSKRRMYFASPSSGGSKPSNATGTRSAPRAPLDTFRGAWYTPGVGSTTTADIHHSAAEGVALGRSVSRIWTALLTRFRRWFRPRPRLDVVWYWRKVHRVAGRDAARVRIVWSTAFRDGYAGLAHFDGRGAEVNGLAMRSSGEAVLTALHEVVHLRRDNGRHDRAFLRDLHDLAGALVETPKLPARVRRAEIQAYEEAVSAALTAEHPSKPRAVRWRRV